MAEEVDQIVFKRTSRSSRTSSLRRAAPAAVANDNQGSDEDDDCDSKIVAARLEQRMKKRAKGLHATVEVAESVDALVEAEKEIAGIGTEFTEQTSTTELDRARERYVEEQLERVRRGEEPLAPFPKTQVGDLTTIAPAAPTTDRFVSESQQQQSTLWASTSRVVPEVDLPGDEARKQYDDTKRIMELARARDQQQPAAPAYLEHEHRAIHNYNALAFSRPQKPMTDAASRKKFIEQNRHRF
jgi:hypothetical protein